MKQTKHSCFRARTVLAAITIMVTIIALFPSMSFGAKVTIGSLPFTAPNHSGDRWDTLVIHPDSGGVLHSQNHGIILKSGQNSRWLIDLSGTDGVPGNDDDDTIIFGRDISFRGESSFNSCGLIPTPYYGTPGDSVWIKGGYWLHRPDGITATSTYATSGTLPGLNYGIMAWYGSDDLIVDSVAAIEVLGFQGDAGDFGTHCIWMRSSKGLLIRHSRLYNRVYGYTSRMSFQSSCLKYQDANAPAISDDEFHVRVEDSYIESWSHCGIVMWGHYGDDLSEPYIVFQMEACSLLVDQRNTYGARFVNGYAAMLRGIGGSNSYIKDNVFLAGDNYNGGRGIEAREWNTVPYGSSYYPAHPDTIEVSGNYFNMHQGCDDEYGVTIWSSMCLKVRRGNHHSWFHDNVFINTLDTNTRAGTGYSPMGEAVTLQVEMDASDPDRSPYHITFEDNICSLKVVTPNQTYRGSAMNMQSNVMLDETDTTIKIRNNYLYSEGGSAVIFATNWDATAKGFLIENNTFDCSADKGVYYGTVNLGSYLGSWDHVIRDSRYLNAASSNSVCHRGSLTVTSNDASREWDLWNERTLRVYARGSNDLPVVNAACSVWNNYGELVMARYTNEGGKASAPVRYFYYNRNTSDSTAYNVFTIKMAAGSDVTTDNSFTITWQTSGGTDTLDLVNTIGTGVWGSEEEEEDDVIGPGRIDDMNAQPGDEHGSIDLHWQAPSDDDGGTVDSYGIMWSLEPINVSNWSPDVILGDPAPPGNDEYYTITGLNPGYEYYLAIRSYDDLGNISALSNIALSYAAGIRSPPDLLTQVSLEEGTAVLTCSTVDSYYDPLSYEFTLVDSSAPSEPLLASTSEIVNNQASVTFEGLDETTYYRWFCRTVAVGQDSSDWSLDTARFSLYNVAPSRPAPVSPLDQDTVVTSAEVIAAIVGNGADYDGPDPLTYVFELYDWNGSSLLASSESIDEGTETTEWSMPVSEAGGNRFSWRARCFDGTDYSQWTSLAQFTVLDFAGGDLADQPIARAGPSPIWPPDGDCVTFFLPETPVDVVILSASGETVLINNGVSGEWQWCGQNSSGNTVATGIYLWWVTGSAGRAKGKITVVKE